VYFPSPLRKARTRRSNQFTPVMAIVNGALQSLADIVLQPVILLSAIVFLLGGSLYHVAGFTVASLASWAWAGSIVPPMRALLRREYHVVIVGGIIRLVAVVAIGLIGYGLADDSSGSFVRNLLIAYVVYQLGSAIIGRASANSISGAASSASRRGLFRNRAMTGVLVGVIGGATTWSVLGSDGTAGENAGILLVLASIATVAATWFLIAIPGTNRIESPAPYGNRSLAQAFGAIRSSGFRRFLFFRALLAVSAAADPFIVIYGIRELGLTLGDVGLGIAVYAAGHFAGILIWPRWVASRSARGPLQITSLIRLLMLIMAVSVPTIATSQLYADRFDGPEVATRYFVAIFGLLGLVVSANNSSNQPYLLDIFPAAMGSAAISMTNACLGALAFGPLGAAYLVNRFSLESMLYVAITLAFVALLTSGLLVESRVRVRQRSGSRRVQRTMSRSTA